MYSTASSDFFGLFSSNSKKNEYRRATQNPGEYVRSATVALDFDDLTKSKHSCMDSQDHDCLHFSYDLKPFSEISLECLEIYKAEVDEKNKQRIAAE